VAVREVVHTAVDVSRAAAEAKRLNVVLEADADAEVMGDPARLQQIVTNVLSNALKFTPDGGTITVELTRSQADVCLRVTDTGIGIASDFLPRIFDRFTQQDSSASRQHGGLGLGLAIVRHLVDVHGGSITAESQGPGRGAAFTIILPACTEEPPAAADAGEPVEPERPEAPAVGLMGIRVLAVDDDADARELMATALTILGAEVVVTATAEQALDELRGGGFDVLLADLGMPGTDGYAFIEAVRRLPGKEATIPAIAVTAFGRQQDRARALSAGYQAHLAKPVLPDQLAAAIAWFVALHRAGTR
jgi:CheY-like chemotaxis protein/anti-sigma regulatory factor (Ser/Thr protein kinase)